MIKHEYFGDIDDNYNEFGGQITMIENTIINGKNVECQLYIDKDSVQPSTLDALAYQHEHLDMLDKSARNILVGACDSDDFIYDYLNSIEEYDSATMEELLEQSDNGESITATQFVAALEVTKVWLSSAADNEVYKYEPGLLESDSDDKDIHTHLSYNIEGTVNELLLFVHFNLQGKFVKVTYGPEY